MNKVRYYWKIDSSKTISLLIRGLIDLVRYYWKIDSSKTLQRFFHLKKVLMSDITGRLIPQKLSNNTVPTVPSASDITGRLIPQKHCVHKSDFFPDCVSDITGRLISQKR